MISVIVPVYNAAEYLEQCIQSILGQSYTNLEIILVDDCSSDQSLDICRNYASKDKRIKVLYNTSNQGQVYSYTKGIKAATGDFIAFVDSDDWIAPTMIEELYQGICTSQADIAACGCWHVYPDQKVQEPIDIQKIGTRCFDRGEIIKAAGTIHTPANVIEYIIKLYRCNKLFRKELLLNNLEFIQLKVRVFEDNNLVIPCILDAKKIIYINKPLYYYRRSHSSTMSLFNEEVLKNMELFFENQEYIFKIKDVRHDMRSDVYMGCAYVINAVLKSKIDSAKKKQYLQIVGRWINKYHIVNVDVRQYGASKQFYFIFKLISHQQYGVSIILGKIYNFIKNI